MVLSSNLLRRVGMVGAVCLLLSTWMPTPAEESPVALRVTHFTVPPSTGPVTHVLIQNLQDTPYEGVVRLKLPDGWRWTPAESPVTLEGKERKRLPFAIEKATNVKANTYAVEATATSGDGTTVRRQSIVCASAPYYSPEIDGKLKEWEDALPVRFVHGGKETIVRTYWNRRNFFLAVTVEEDEHSTSADGPRDAVQFALAPHGAVTGDSGDGPAARYEFLITAGKRRWSKPACYMLLKPDMPLSVATSPRDLAALALPEADVAVRRKKGYTYYECAIPFSLMPAIRATEGRELSFSLLIHDPDGAGLRDWGESAGLWPWQRNPLAWCRWHGAQWGEAPPYDGKIEWGLCSSIH